MTDDRAPGGAIDIHGHSVPRAFLDEVVRTGSFGVRAEVADGKYYVTFPGHKPLRPVAGVMLDSTDRGGWLAEQQVPSGRRALAGHRRAGPVGRRRRALGPVAERRDGRVGGGPR
jgi:hypothetical protein